MISQNRAVPILLVLTFAFILYLGGCFGSEETTTANLDDETPEVTTPTVPPVVAEIDPSLPTEEPFFHTVEDDDRLGSIASKYCVTTDVILRANPDLNPNVIIVGQTIRIPGATCTGEQAEVVGPDRADGVVSDYVVEGGDTMGGIANRWTVSLEALREANPDVEQDALQVNQLLVIPPYGTGLDPAEVAARTTPVPVQREPGEILEHPVAAGEFISAIAEIYSVTSSAIIDLNGLPDGGNNIQVGDILLIPPPTEPEPTAEPTAVPAPAEDTDG